MAPDGETNSTEIRIREIEMMITAYNTQLIEAEKQLTTPELERQKVLFMARVQGMMVKILGGENIAEA